MMKSQEAQFGQFINSVCAQHNSSGTNEQEITSLQALREQEIEPFFEGAFRPDRDQIDYLKKKQKCLQRKLQISEWQDKVKKLSHESQRTQTLRQQLLKKENSQDSENSDDDLIWVDELDLCDQDVMPPLV
jgi:hypothetical protein